MVDLSIVLPTCNRADLLDRALRAIHADTHCSHEIIVVNGASTDHTAEVLAGAAVVMGDRLKVIHEEQRQGFVRAANKGFRAASGRYLTWLNDDARPVDNALDLAVHQLDRLPDDVAFIAMFHRWHSTWNVAYQTTLGGRVYRLCHVRGTLYANFPVGRRKVFEQLDYFDERYYFYAADPDLSLKAWHAGMRVAPAYGCAIDHDEVDDDRRANDSNRGREDNRRLFDKWLLPPRNPSCNDFNPERPCTLAGLRQTEHPPLLAA